MTLGSCWYKQAYNQFSSHARLRQVSLTRKHAHIYPLVMQTPILSFVGKKTNFVIKRINCLELASSDTMLEIIDASWSGRHLNLVIDF